MVWIWRKCSRYRGRKGLEVSDLGKKEKHFL